MIKREKNQLKEDGGNMGMQVLHIVYEELCIRNSTRFTKVTIAVHRAADHNRNIFWNIEFRRNHLRKVDKRILSDT